MPSVSLLFVIFSLVGCSSSVQTQEKPTLVSPFQYDRGIPLEQTIQVIESTKTVKRYRVEFQGMKERVEANFIVPVLENGKPPVILLLHGYGGNKEQMGLFANAIVGLGYATFALDAPLHGKRAKPGRDIFDSNLDVLRDNFIEAVVDYRRAIDYLKTRFDVDSSRILVMGVSMGGFMASQLAGADTRVSAAVLLITGGDIVSLIKESKLPRTSVLRKSLEEMGEDNARKKFHDFDPATWVAKISPRPVLIVSGTRDEIIPQVSTDALINSAKEPKTVFLENMGHTLNPESLLKIYNWLREYRDSN